MLSVIRAGQNLLPAAARRSLRAALIVYLVGRVLLSLWAAVVVQIVPAPLEPHPILRPYQGQPAFLEGMAGTVLGPWQRFDTMHYLSLARDGYEVQNSVFPPLYPLLIGVVGSLVELLTPASAALAALAAALIVSNIALITALALLHYLTAQEMGEAAAGRAIIYLILFPTGFFLFAGYSESLFLLLAIGAIFLARRDDEPGAGLLGLLGAFTRLTGAVLCLPLTYAYACQRSFDWRRLDWRVVGVALPALGLPAFLLWRNAAGLPPIAQVYEQYWYQATGVPGSDLWLGLRSLVTGSGPRAGEISLLLDILVTGFLMLSTALVFRHLGVTYGLYGASLLLFMLLPSSELKPLYSFSRYALMFFPTFMLMGRAGSRPWLHRLIVYLSLLLTLFFSGQFFLWGWVG